MDIKKTFGTDKEKETNGVWENFGDGCKIRIARMNNPAYTAAFNRLISPVQKKYARRTLDEGVLEEIVCRAMGEAIITDWAGLKENGKPLKYSPETAYRLLMEYPDFKDQVYHFCAAMENYLLDWEEDAEGNSKAS